MKNKKSFKPQEDNLNSTKSDKVVESLTLKERAGDAANNWLAKNRSLVLRQTPVWAQSLAVMLILLGAGTVMGGIFFRVDEVVTAQGN